MFYSRQAPIALRVILTFAVLLTNVPAQEPSFSAQSNVVIVPALVRDAKGGAVYGLQAKDFVVEDDGVEQVVQLDEAAESEPVSVVVAVQTGRRAEREFPRIRGLRAMLQPIFGQPDAMVSLIEFDSKVNFVQNFTHDEDSVEKKLQQLQPGDDGAGILDAVDESVKLLNTVPQGRQRVLLLISETRDYGSKAKVNDVVIGVGRSNTVVYALPFSPALSQVLDTERGSNIDEWRMMPDLMALLNVTLAAMKKNVPRTIASMTGGEYELFSSHTSFETKMTSFSNHLHSRYVLSFAPKSPHSGLHEIHVRLREPGKDTVLFRTNYWAQGSD
jgi:VWFA-related protein